MKQENIRNFCIIAHIDHGKSTLADRILEYTKALDKRELKSQMLDSLDIERERGITIKLNAVEITYKTSNDTYYLNLIDTPGHVDFSYEVSRSLAASDGAILVVDATQGVQAQTLANLYLAVDNNLDIIPVINKIDLPNAMIDQVTDELINLGFNKEDIVLTSAKTGEGIDKLVNKIITNIKPPKGSSNEKLQALIFDSVYDSYKGIIISIRVKNGIIKLKDEILMMQNNTTYEVINITKNTPFSTNVDSLKTGEVGYIYASIKTISDVLVGDTITLKKSPTATPLKGYKKMMPMVYSGIYPIDSKNYDALKEALEKLKLNDAALVVEAETSTALGFGFRCGFLGLLHMEIIEERIEREFNIEIIATSPSVIYQVITTKGKTLIIDAPAKMPEKSMISKILEPFVLIDIFTPSVYIGSIMKLAQEKRGTFINIDYLDKTRAVVKYEIPLSEIVFDFFDKLKSITKGYASFNYETTGYKESNLVKVDILLNGEIVDALSFIVEKDFAYNRGRNIVSKLKEIIPRQMFEVPIQASIGVKVIARCDIKAMRKNVLAKCYGGDITRKKKLLEKQKQGKKRMKKIGSVELPQEAFLSILKASSND